MDKYERAAFRFSHCAYRDLIGCIDFMCVDCPDSRETYQIFLNSENKKERIAYEKDYPFPQETSSCPF